jgi:hypothetical protein
MARKPRHLWTPAYRQRVERKERKLRAAGVRGPIPRHVTRGHKAAEHVTRAEHEAERIAAVGGLTARQRQSVREFAREQAGKIRQYQDNREALVAPMLAWATGAGYDVFTAMRAAQREARRQYNQEAAEGSYESRGGGALDLMAADYGLPDPRWMYYHT